MKFWYQTMWMFYGLWEFRLDKTMPEKERQTQFVSEIASFGKRKSFSKNS